MFLKGVAAGVKSFKFFYWITGLQSIWNFEFLERDVPAPLDLPHKCLPPI